MSELVRFSRERADQIVGFFRIGPARRHYTLGYFRMQRMGSKDCSSDGWNARRTFRRERM